MKRLFSVVLVSALTATWIGCQSETESTPPPPPPDSSAADSATESTVPPAGTSASDAITSEFTLVSLKVPNMT